MELEKAIKLMKIYQEKLEDEELDDTDIKRISTEF